MFIMLDMISKVWGKLLHFLVAEMNKILVHESNL